MKFHFLHCIAFFAASTSVLATPPGESITYNNWVVGCDNANSCRAVSMLGESSDFNEGPTLSFYRAGGAQGTMAQLQFDSSMLDRKTAMGAAVTFAIDGKIYTPEKVSEAVGDGLGGISEREADGDGVSEQRQHMTVNVKAMRDMAAGKILTIQDKMGTTLGSYPLKGLHYALRYIDAKQSRDGTVTAVIDAGENGEDYVYSGGPYPTIYVPPRVPGKPAQMPPESAVVAWQKIGTCDDTNMLDAKDTGGRMEIHWLDQQFSLAQISCYSGAYNFSDIFLVVSKDGVQPARFDIAPYVVFQGGLPSIINADFNPESGKLNGFSKGRGLADCGSSKGWIWDPNAQLFRLTDYSEMTECRGANDWIERWKADVVYGNPPK